MIEVGARAPSFSLLDQDLSEVSLADFAGSRLVLAFYPADFSPVCSDQLSIYQEVLGEIRARGAELVGISVDGPHCHAAFRAHAGLEFPLLSDFHPKGAVATSYGAYLEKRGHCSRTLAVIDPAGVIAFSYTAPYPEIPGANLIFDGLAAA